MNYAVPSEERLIEACRIASERHPGVSVAEIRGPRKPRRIAHARWTAWRVLREWGYGASPIARRWGCDHTTILNAWGTLKRVREAS